MKLEVRWIADYRSGTHLSVQFTPIFEGLSARVNESLHTPMTLRPFPAEVAGELQVLAGLAADLTDISIEPVEDRPWTVEPHVLERDVTGVYGGRTSAYWLRFDFFLRHSIGLRDRRWSEWQQVETPPEMQSLVRRVDEFAMTVARTAWSERYNDFARRENTARYLPPPAQVFISYRSAQQRVIDFAARIHDALSSSGESSFFRVFLDRPDLRAGEWKPQLAERIRKCEVFVPILTEDYEGGDTSLWERDEALSAHSANRRPQIVPLLCEGRWQTHGRLKDFNGVLLLVESDEGLFRDQIGRLRSLIVDAASQQRK